MEINSDDRELVLSPYGRLYFQSPLPQQGIQAAFLRGTGHGLLYLGISDSKAELSPLLTYWRNFSRLFLTQLCAIPDLASLNWQEKRAQVPLPTEELEKYSLSAPPMRGAEYLDINRL